MRQLTIYFHFFLAKIIFHFSFDDEDVKEKSLFELKNLPVNFFHS